MLIYNVTTNIDREIESIWLKWMRENHIKDVLATGKFHKALLTKVLVEEEMGGTTYSVQYQTRSRQDLDEYFQSFAQQLREDALSLFGDKMVSFRTELEIIEEFDAPEL